VISLAQRVRDFRYAKGWGPDELASRAEISRTALYQIESGKTGLPRAGTLRRIAEALDVSMDELLGHLDASTSHAPSIQAHGGRTSHEYRAPMPRPRELNEWIPSEGGPLSVAGHSLLSGASLNLDREDHRGDDGRPTHESLRLRASSSPEAVLHREGELMSRLHDLLHSPLGPGIARIIEELHQFLPKSRIPS
jgi:transcriptional regulator with XRE-family HTH domain